ncbi:nascent polypeptide-associated complex protein [Candidatus Woesearchaeota archaeon CG_4_10_14_0_2_um_filter_33_13]|nr:MAG: nascent polypeptide-associated complex protein [Candidatus Woesearchaeota archaeon CG_4_10_14_0_2_um_filter_33_13]
MIPGINPRKMQQMMKQMGIQQQEIPAVEVIIRTEDKELIISNPSVQKVNMMGQINFQISGEVKERSLQTTPEINDEDIKTVMEQAKVNYETAKKAIENADGDLAEAILNLSDSE